MLQKKELKAENNQPKRVVKEKNSSYNKNGDSACHIKEGIKIMASHKNVSASLHDDKGTWVVRARVYDPNTGKTKNKSKSTGLKVKDNTKRKAERAMREIAEQWEKEANAAALSDNPYFSESVRLWLEKKAVSVVESTLYSYTYQAERYVIPALGSFRIKDLTLAHLQRFYNIMLTDKNVKSVKMCHHVIRGTLMDAVRSGIIPVNFATYAEFPKIQKYEGQSYTADQVRQLLTAAKEEGEPFYTAIMLATIYGLRRSEICGLRWSDIDFDKGTLNVCNTVIVYGGIQKEVDRTKTKSSKRTIWLVESTIPHLKALKQKQIELGLDGRLVCTRMNGKKIGESVNPEIVYYHFKKAIKTAGLQNIRLHDLRHTAATLLAEEATPKQVQNFLGHSNISITMDIYTHLAEHKKMETSNIMNDIIVQSALL